MRIRMKAASVLLAVSALGAMTAIASAPAYAATTYHYIYVVDGSTKWYMSNCNNANGTCTLTTTSKYYGEYSFQSAVSYGGATYYEMVDKATGECITYTSIDEDLVEQACGTKGQLDSQYWHYNGTSKESTNLYAVKDLNDASQSCMLAWAADPADSTYAYTCGEGWNDAWSQPVT
jgi:hypothetical protein